MINHCMQEANNVGTLLHITALKAECSVLCSGALFDQSGLHENTGYLYPWLEALLGMRVAFKVMMVHGRARESCKLFESTGLMLG